jgi:Ala-tRNA(Pro) deacylase
VTEDIEEVREKRGLAESVELRATAPGNDHPAGPAATPAELFALLDRLGIETETVTHAPVFTVAESSAIKRAIPGGHSKNLFLKDRKGRLFLLVARDEARIDLKRLPEAIGTSGRLSFGSANLLRTTLGVEPGSVTPFAAMNDRARRVMVILDADLMAFARANFHPLVNSMTTTIACTDLIRFFEATGHQPRVMALPEPEARGAPEQRDDAEPLA